MRRRPRACRSSGASSGCSPMRDGAAALRARGCYTMCQVARVPVEVADEGASLGAAILLTHHEDLGRVRGRMSGGSIRGLIRGQ